MPNDQNPKPYASVSDDEINDMVKSVVEEVDKVVPPRNDGPSLRVRISVVIAAIIIISNTVVSIYNSIALREQVECNRELTTALNIVGDQNRNNTKEVIDFALSGPHTQAELNAARIKYDTKFDANTKKRQNLLSTTCQAGDSTPNPDESGS